MSRPIRYSAGGAPVQTYVKQAAAAENVPEDLIGARIAANIALCRIVKDEECALAALFPASDYASRKQVRARHRCRLWHRLLLISSF